MDEILARHRKECKDLQNRITGMKKQATKSTRKEVNSKCLNLQESLKFQHEQEINALNHEGSQKDKDEDEVDPEKLLEQLQLDDVSDDKEKAQVELPIETPKKRRNRQRERLAKRDARISMIKEQAKLEASTQEDLKQIEQDSIDQLCALNHLTQYDIQPDGHCLFASILDQLKLRHDGDKIQDLNVYKLRSLACNYIRDHKEEFIPYLFDETTLSLKDIDEYTAEMESTAKWGGELEVLALSKTFDCPISILMSGRSTHIINEESHFPELKLVYYRHTYALGEHYNSLHDEI